MSYYEIRMVNNDLFKTEDPPEKWKEVRLIEEVPGRKTGNYFSTMASFKDIRISKEVMINPDFIVSIRLVETANDRMVNMIADDEFIEDTKNLTMNLLGSILGGSSKKEEIITIDNKDDD